MDVLARQALAAPDRQAYRAVPEATQPAYQRCTTFNKLSPFHDTLEQALKVDSFRAKHNRRSAKAFFEQIKAEDYDGGYSQLAAFVRSWRGEQGNSLRAFVPLTFALGEAFQFDWSEEGLLIGGLFRRIQVSHKKLRASRAFWLFAGWLRSGKRAAAIMSLIQSARLNDHHPNAYLKDVLRRLQTRRARQIDELLPHSWMPV